MRIREMRRSHCHDLLGKEMVSFFMGESLRTRFSFEIAFQRLGGTVVCGSEAAKIFSSIAKGESVEDTFEVLCEYFIDRQGKNGEHNTCFVLRTDVEGDARRAAAVSAIPVINAGDGPGQHPTQALLDLYAIRNYHGKINGTKVALIGGLKDNRVVQSLAYLLGKYEDITMYFVSPKHLQIKQELKDHLQKHNVIFHEVTDIREVALEASVLYQTRTQTNAGTEDWNRADENNGLTIINKEVLNMIRTDAIIMHPLPCKNEIVRHEVDPDPRAIYIKSRNGKPSQVKGGLYIREALFKLILST